MKKQQIPLKNSLILLLTATIWGIAFVAQSEGGEAVGPLTFNATRNINPTDSQWHPAVQIHFPATKP